MNKIPVQVKIDDQDWSRVKLYKWKKYPSCRYVQANISGKTTAIHRFILDAPLGASIDHINGDTSDNRRENLRICSHAANMKNRKPNKNGTSAYKGVIVLGPNRFRSKIDSDGVRYELGVYPTERDAVVAYNAAAKVLHGEFAYMNELPAPIQSPAITDTAPLYYILRRTVGKTTGHYEYWCIDGRFWSDEIYAHGCIYDKHDAEEYQRDYGGEILPIRLLVGGAE